MNDDKRLVIWGAPGHAMVVADVARRRGFEVVGFVDDLNPERANPSSAAPSSAIAPCWPMAVALPMAAVVYAIGRWWHAGTVTELFALTGLGIVVFSAFAWTAGLKAVAEVRALVPRDRRRNDSAA